ncbi:MAG: cyclic nucleotide-binding domain-containing protein [Nitrospirota bacterium]
MADIRVELQVQTLLRGLDENEIGKIIPLLTTLNAQKDTSVFREGEPSRGIYMITRGRVEISKTTPDGWRQPLVILSRGNFMGEIAVLEKTHHCSDAKAFDAAELLLFPTAAFEEMEKKEPFIMLKIIKNIAIISGMNVRRMNDKFIKALVNY